MKKPDQTPQVNQPQANYGTHIGAKETLSLFLETDKILFLFEISKTSFRSLSQSHYECRTKKVHLCTWDVVIKWIL